MLVVISDSTFLPGEAGLVNDLFRSGMDLFHIRKYTASEQELTRFIEEIDPGFRPQVVLNHHHELGAALGLNRFHYSEKDREFWREKEWKGIDPEAVYSTSVHSVEGYNALPEHFSYAFLSPVFDSISKPGYTSVSFDLSKRKQGGSSLIALGGIQAVNVQQAIEQGFDGVALLGAIWHSENPVETIQICSDAINRTTTKQYLKIT